MMAMEEFHVRSGDISRSLKTKKDLGTSCMNIESSGTEKSTRTTFLHTTSAPQKNERKSGILPQASSTTNTSEHMELEVESYDPTTNLPIYVKPKRCLTPYNIFFQQQRRQILAQIPHRRTSKAGTGHGKVTFAELGRLVGAQWKETPVSERRFFEELAAKDKQRYVRQMKIWEKAMKDLHKASESTPNSFSVVREGQKQDMATNNNKKRKALAPLSSKAPAKNKKKRVVHSKVDQAVPVDQPEIIIIDRHPSLITSAIASAQNRNNSGLYDIPYRQSANAILHQIVKHADEVVNGSTASDNDKFFSSSFSTEFNKMMMPEPISGPCLILPSLPTLASKMGSECTELFLNIFRQ